MRKQALKVHTGRVLSAWRWASSAFAPGGFHHLDAVGRRSLTPAAASSRAPTVAVKHNATGVTHHA